MSPTCELVAFSLFFSQFKTNFVLTSWQISERAETVLIGCGTVKLFDLAVTSSRSSSPLFLGTDAVFVYLHVVTDRIARISFIRGWVFIRNWFTRARTVHINHDIVAVGIASSNLTSFINGVEVTYFKNQLGQTGQALFISDDVLTFFGVVRELEGVEHVFIGVHDRYFETLLA